MKNPETGIIYIDITSDMVVEMGRALGRIETALKDSGLTHHDREKLREAKIKVNAAFEAFQSA